MTSEELADDWMREHPQWKVDMAYRRGETVKREYTEEEAKKMDAVSGVAPSKNAYGALGTIKDSGERVTYASGSQRDPSTGKLDWTRITFGPMMRRWAQHLTTAEQKYPDKAPGVPNFMLINTEVEYYRYKKSAF